MAEEHDRSEAEPQTPQQFKFRFEPDKYLPAAEATSSPFEGTFPETPETWGGSIFSQQGSVKTETTHGYICDSPIPDRKSSRAPRDRILTSPTRSPLLDPIDIQKKVRADRSCSLSSPTQNLWCEHKRQELKRFQDTALVNRHSRGFKLRKATSEPCLTTQLRASSTGLEEHSILEDRNLVPRSTDLLFGDMKSISKVLLRKLIVTGRSRGLVLPRAKSAECLRTRLANSTPNPQERTGSGETPKRKSSVLNVNLKPVSEQGLLLTEILKVKEDKTSEQGLLMPKKQRHTDPDRLVLNIERIDINFGSQRRVSQQSSKRKSDATSIKSAEKERSEADAPDPKPDIAISTAAVVTGLSAPDAPFDPTSITELLTKIFPSDFCQRLNENKERCVASLVKDVKRRCSKNHKGDIQKFYDSLKNPTNDEFGGAVHCIARLIDSSLCTVHKKSAERQLNDWRPNLSRSLHTERQDQEPEMYRLSALAECIKTLKLHELEPISSVIERPETRGTTSRVRSFSAAIHKFGAENIDPEAISQSSSQIRYFTPYLSKSNTGKPLSQLLEDKILEPFKQDKEGLIYIYWQPGNFGHVKIGRSKDIAKRLGTWEGKCRKDLELFFPGEEHEHDMQPVEHISRVETLVHLELRNRRKKVKCSDCGHEHIEWFEVSCLVAVDIVRKWMGWIRKKPYKRIYEYDKTRWMCFDEETAGNLLDICQPHRELTESPSIGHSESADRSLSVTPDRRLKPRKRVTSRSIKPRTASSGQSQDRSLGL